MSPYDYSTKVTISIQENNNLDDYPDCNWTVSFDAADFTPTQWFRLFEKVLIQVGFTEPAIMTGAAALAFDETRRPEDMRKIYHDLELEEFCSETEEVDEASI
jgi:hypothetical protein